MKKIIFLSLFAALCLSLSAKPIENVYSSPQADWVAQGVVEAFGDSYYNFNIWINQTYFDVEYNVQYTSRPWQRGMEVHVKLHGFPEYVHYFTGMTPGSVGHATSTGNTMGLPTYIEWYTADIYRIYN